MRFLAWRLGIFFAVVFALGFIPRLLLGPDFADLVLVEGNHPLRRFGDHMAKGGISTFTCAGGWALIQIMTGLQWVRVFTGYPFNTAGDVLGGPRGKGKDAQLGGILVLLAIAGAVCLVWKLV